ncbi:M48 family metallopeptidase [Pelagibacteraceae bacterium]|nr:M48 family metallopeptidase [Pelagibacteraceae bacterium]
MNRRKFIELFGGGCCGLILPSCTTVPITKRRQLSIYPESSINNSARKAYASFKTKNKLIIEGKEIRSIKNIGKRIEFAVSKFFLNKDGKDPTSDFQWDYILVDNDKIKNAWCMPGGKIAVYTGILKITQNENALAAVMGHEIAHAVAKHSVERASQALTVNIGTQVADIFLGGAINRARNTVGNASGMDIFQLGIFNPFGRKQETEADYLGLIFSSLAGYDIREAAKLWERMSESNKGKEPPQFMSTHPSSKNRIINLNNWVNEIIVKYPPIKRI